MDDAAAKGIIERCVAIDPRLAHARVIEHRGQDIPVIHTMAMGERESRSPGGAPKRWRG
ncbi:hypothetical protein [Streptomyces niveus]|uniref:hypothetical protein n=1 Tax=Streptomyces niveus TaxID=193462 RepID=UPI003867EE99